ncbi:hypothetical protein [Sphingomonas daechungensis]|uniref:hypothetical protein n=1 Tax=Sphingomonas daechungensis TaxID=1176646 RepID=UPI003784D8E8
MTDEPQPEAGGERPKFFNSVTGWIGGLTAVVLALAGLKAAAGQLDLFGPAEPAQAEQAAATQETQAAEEPQAVAETPAADALPSKSTGTWKGQEVTLEWRNGIWVEVTAEGTEDEIVTNYEQLARTDVMTNGIDRNRNLYVRWPSEGGTLEESEDGITWTRSYEVTPA